MKQTTIRQLNHVNRVFYETVLDDFHRTRQHAWPGWKKLTPFFEEMSQETPREFKVLDVGCGNGRFGVFLQETFPQNVQKNLVYTGIDFNQKLLGLAKERLSDSGITHELHAVDLVEDLLTGSFSASLEMLPPQDSIVLFGVMHHVPSFHLRRQLLTVLANMLSPNGLLIVTYWKFLDVPRLKRRLISLDDVTTTLGLTTPLEDLEQNDFFLDWQRGTNAIRYCHYVDQPEAGKLVQNLSLEMLTEFTADGNENSANQYQIWKKV